MLRFLPGENFSQISTDQSDTVEDQLIDGSSYVLQ